jgi:hypothetical protein
MGLALAARILELIFSGTRSLSRDVRDDQRVASLRQLFFPPWDMPWGSASYITIYLFPAAI